MLIHNTGQVVPIEGRINCKMKGGYLYLLWSKRVPAIQYLGSSYREPRVRFGEHRRDIIDRNEEKAVSKHFLDTNSTADDLVFVPFKKVRSRDRHILRYMETKLINEYNLIEAGVNRILS